MPPIEKIPLPSAFVLMIHFNFSYFFYYLAVRRCARLQGERIIPVFLVQTQGVRKAKLGNVLRCLAVRHLQWPIAAHDVPAVQRTDCCVGLNHGGKGDEGVAAPV